MKKYWGKKEWSETLYLSEELVEYNGEYERSGIDEYCLEPVDFLYGFGFNDRNLFEDTNSFITYSEIFNIYQLGKI